jgi:hypothetical protein
MAADTSEATVAVEKPEVAQEAAAPVANAASQLASRRILSFGAAIGLLVAGVWVGVPWIKRALNTISTDDAT